MCTENFVIQRKSSNDILCSCTGNRRGLYHQEPIPSAILIPCSARLYFVVYNQWANPGPVSTGYITITWWKIIHLDDLSVQSLTNTFDISHWSGFKLASSPNRIVMKSRSDWGYTFKVDMLRALPYDIRKCHTWSWYTDYTPSESLPI